MPYHAYAWPRALHSRFTDAQALRAGELSRGVGLRGFESHSPHHKRTHDIIRDVLSNITFSSRTLVRVQGKITLRMPSGLGP